MRWLTRQYVKECRRGRQLADLSARQNLKIVAQAKEIVRLRKLLSEAGAFIRVVGWDDFPPPADLVER